MSVSHELASWDEIAARAQDLADSFAERAAERDAERDFPHAEMKALRESRLGGICVSQELGGLGRSYGDACRLIRILAEADSNIAQMSLIHLHGHEQFKALAEPDTIRDADERVARGELWWTNAYSERKGKNILDYKTTIVQDGDDWVLNGVKFYSTGSLAGTEMYVNAVIPGTDSWRMAFVPTDAPGVNIIDDWDAMGQRTTASGTTEFKDVRVPSARVADIDRVNSLDAADSLVSGVFPQCCFSAIFVGIARAAVRDTVDYLSNRSRPWMHSGVERASDDPYALLHVGEMEARVRAAETLQERALETLDWTRENLSAETRARAAIDAAATKVVSLKTALEVSKTLFQVCGASSSLQRYSYDRHWRNARTLSLHDPVDYKTKIIGDWAVNGTAPPVTIYT